MLVIKWAGNTMEKTYSSKDITISLCKKGSDRYTKTSYPVRYGSYSEVRTPDHIYHFNPNGEIIFARGRNGDWVNPQEWLKRSRGNDWIYYSTGGYTGVFEAIGEYYLPNLQYPTNSLLGGSPFATEPVHRIINDWHGSLEDVFSSLTGVPLEIRRFLDNVIGNNPAVLEAKARTLFTLSGGRVTVLPPDSRHVDYNTIPLIITLGCLYKCRFCKVKNSNPFKEKEKREIEAQLNGLKRIYRNDLANHNSVFLGEHDALCATTDLLLYSIERSYNELDFSSSNIRGAYFFLFGSVDSLLNAEDRLFDEMRRFPANFYINIGMESADQDTLDHLGKPITVKMVKEAFSRMQRINDSCLNVEVTANFLMDEELPDSHYPRFVELVRDSLDRKKPKGCIYLSPIKFSNPSRHLVNEFSKLKLLSRLPTFLYIIQRL